MSLPNPTSADPAALEQDAIATRADRRGDAARRRRLRHNRALATGLLVTMAMVALATHFVAQSGFLVLLLRAGAEAGVVGGLADWFAVTALFRHPLGLPIPHTAIIPSNKDRIGRTLGRFVEHNFLTKDAVLKKVRNANVGQRFATWLASPATAKLLAGWIANAFPYLIRSLENRDLREFADITIREQLERADIAPVIGRAIRILTSSGEADALFERIVDAMLRWLQTNKEKIDQVVAEHSRWWIPRAIDRRISAAIVEGISDLLNGLRQPDSEIRQQFRETLSNSIEEMVHSPEYRAQLNDAKNRILHHPEVRAWTGSVAKEVTDTILDDLAQPASKLRATIERAIGLIGRTLLAGEGMQRNIDAIAEHLAIGLVSWRGEIGNFIAEVVRNWDTKTLSERLELAVGSDLQYIRMNGTIVGAIAGSAIFLASSLLG